MKPITSFSQFIKPHTCPTIDSSDSSDSEMNSCGSDPDFIFDIESMSSESESSEEKCEILTGKFSHFYNNLQSCCQYSDDIIYLLKDTSINCFNTSLSTTRHIKNNRHLLTIVSYDGYLYSLDTYNHLYYLCNHYYDCNYWVWKRVKWAPQCGKNYIQITHMNTTLNCDYLLLQTDNYSYLYNNCTFEKLKIIGKRIYGKNINCYLEIEEYVCYVHIDNVIVKTYRDVKSGVLNYCNDVFLIKKYDQLNHVTMINHKPYFY